MFLITMFVYYTQTRSSKNLKVGCGNCVWKRDLVQHCETFWKSRNRKRCVLVRCVCEYCQVCNIGNEINDTLNKCGDLQCGSNEVCVYSYCRSRFPVILQRQERNKKEWLKMYGCCCCCDQLLTDPSVFSSQSLATGIALQFSPKKNAVFSR